MATAEDFFGQIEVEIQGLKRISVTRQARVMPNVFDTQKFIISLAETKSYSSDQEKILERLIKKSNIVQKLYKYYTEDLEKKISDEELDFHIQKLYIYLLMKKSLEKNDLKAINTVYKICGNMDDDLHHFLDALLDLISINYGARSEK